MGHARRYYVRLHQFMHPCRKHTLQDSDLMAKSNDLRLLGGPGPKRGGDQSQKSDEKWTHRGNDDDLRNGAKTCIFNSDGVLGIHTCFGQTIEAVRGRFVPVARSAIVPASAEHLAAFQQHARIRASYSLEFIDSADWNTTCLQSTEHW